MNRVEEWRHYSKFGSVTMARPWSEDDIATVCRLWNEGYSASRISEAMDYTRTRNAIIGKLFRIGNMAPRKTTKAVVHLWRSPSAQRGRKGMSNGGGVGLKIKTGTFGNHVRQAPRQRAEPAMPPDCQPVTMLDLGLKHCRWIIGETNGEATLFCGATVDLGVTWCAWHHRIVYQPDSAQRRWRTADQHHAG